MAVIVVNLLVSIGAISSGNSDSVVFTALEDMFTSIFILECIVKLNAMGLDLYFKSNW